MTRDISSSSATCPCTMPSMESTRMDSLMCFILMEVNHRGHLDILYETWALFGFYVKNLEFVSFAKEIFKPMGVCMRKKLISIWIEFKTLLEGKTCDKPILNSLVPHRISLTVWCGNPPPSPVLTYTPGWKEVQCTLSILLKNTTGWTLSGYEPWPLNLQSAMLILDISTIGKLPVFMVLLRRIYPPFALLKWKIFSLNTNQWCLEISWSKTVPASALQVAAVSDELLLPLASVGYTNTGDKRLMCAHYVRK